MNSSTTIISRQLLPELPELPEISLIDVNLIL